MTSKFLEKHCSCGIYLTLCAWMCGFACVGNVPGDTFEAVPSGGSISAGESATADAGSTGAQGSVTADVDGLSGTAGEATATTGESTATTGESTATTGESTATTGESTATTAGTTTTTGSATTTTGGVAITTGGSTATTGGSTATTAGSTTTSGSPPKVNHTPQPSAEFLPTVTGTCPALVTGVASFLGQSVQLWAAPASSKNGSLVLYWHGTGGSPGEAYTGLGSTQINDIIAKGGMVAAFTVTTAVGKNTTGNKIWYTGDFTTADEVVACALRDLHIDPRRIYSMGESAGGLQSTWMAYARSGYIAAVAPLSGGVLGQNKNWADPTSTPQDPGNTPFAMVTHGGKGVDVYAPTGFDFAISRGLYAGDIAAKGGIPLDCNTGGGHVSGPPVVCPGIWRFFQDHPFKQTPEPYNGVLPAGFPSYCRIGPVAY